VGSWTGCASPLVPLAAPRDCRFRGIGHQTTKRRTARLSPEPLKIADLIRWLDWTERP
jgi:hypothetical protein